MTRREIMLGAAAMMAGGPVQASDALGPTALVDSDHPEIRRVAASLTSGAADDRDKATSIFRFVRDEVWFGFGRGFWNQKASEVLALKRGYCNTKSTLFVALLRAADIPARQVFVEIDAAVLHGLIDPGTRYLDHSYTEVQIGGAWIATDAYIPDPALFRAAKARTAAEGRVFGYGVHAEGENDWNGTRATFAQYNLNATQPLIGRRWGVFADMAAFYREAEETHNRLNGVLRAAFGALAASANENAQALRKG
ncbi:MAG: transglutaminase-like domain-containing protein [Pseudomonadota bacterium]